MEFTMITALKIFSFTFIAVMIVNQLFYGACFSSYCLAAAFPRVLIMSVLLSWFIYSASKDNNNE